MIMVCDVAESPMLCHVKSFRSHSVGSEISERETERENYLGMLLVTRRVPTPAYRSIVAFLKD